MTIYIYIYIYTCIHPVQTDKPNSDPPNVKSLAETTLFRFSGPKVEDGWNFSQIARAPAEFLWVIARPYPQDELCGFPIPLKYPYISY